jgi:hypothetical protein
MIFPCNTLTIHPVFQWLFTKHRYLVCISSSARITENGNEKMKKRPWIKVQRFPKKAYPTSEK